MSAKMQQPGRSWRRPPTLAGWGSFALAALALAAAPPVGAQQPGALLGWVFDVRGRVPLEGVTVLLRQSGARTSTDRDGRFQLEGVPGGRIALRLMLDGYV